MVNEQLSAVNSFSVMGEVVGFVQSVTFTLRNFLCQTPVGIRDVVVYLCTDAEGRVFASDITVGHLAVDGSLTITVDNSGGLEPFTFRYAVVLLDGVVVDGWEAVGDWEVSTVLLESEGEHEINSVDSFGIMQYGYSPFIGIEMNSAGYAYMGGMKAEVIYIP